MVLRSARFAYVDNFDKSDFSQEKFTDFYSILEATQKCHGNFNLLNQFRGGYHFPLQNFLAY